MSITTVGFYVTAFGQVTLTEQFCKEAARQFPGQKPIRQHTLVDYVCRLSAPSMDRWPDEVGPAIDALMRAAYEANLRPRALKSLAALAPYGIEA